MMWPNLSNRIQRTLLALTWVLLSGCGGDSPTSPEPPRPTSPAPPRAGLAGEWSGTTFQGLPISFTVSEDQRVTTISLGYQIDACAGVDTFAGLTVPFAPLHTTGPSAFLFGENLPDNRQVGIQAFLMSDGSVWGTLLIYGPPSCGPSETVAGLFTATRP